MKGLSQRATGRPQGDLWAGGASVGPGIGVAGRRRQLGRGGISGCLGDSRRATGGRPRVHGVIWPSWLSTSPFTTASAAISKGAECPLGAPRVGNMGAPESARWFLKRSGPPERRKLGPSQLLVPPRRERGFREPSLFERSPRVRADGDDAGSGVWAVAGGWGARGARSIGLLGLPELVAVSDLCAVVGRGRGRWRMGEEELAYRADLAGRKPVYRRRASGEVSPLRADRQWSAQPPSPPPRASRPSPQAGPTGSITGPTG